MLFRSDDYKVPVEGVEVDGVVYAADAEAGTATVAGVTVENGCAIVPEVVVIDEVEYTVTAIAADAFAGIAAEEVRLPNTITTEVELTGYEGYVFVQLGSDTAAYVTGDCVCYKGDYDDDKAVGVGDVIKVIQDLAGSGVEGYAQLACDVAASEGNVIDVSDVIRLLQWLASSSIILD